MDSQNMIPNELNGLNSKLLLPKREGNIFSVPQGYFEGLAEAILARIKVPQEAGAEIEQLSPLLAGLSRKMPFEVPGGYFEHTDLNHLTTEESIPQAWMEVRANPTYTVPAGYFDQLSEKALAKVAPRKEARVISMGQKWMRYATAACLTGLVAISGYLYFGKPGVVDPQAHPNQWVASKLENTSNQELDAFMQTADAAHEIVKVRKPAKTEVKKLLKDVSDKELDAFLDQVPVGDDESNNMN